MAQDMQDNDYELDEEVIVLENEDGEEVKFQHIATIDYQDECYIFLQPVELGDLEEDEVLIFRIDTDEDGNDLYVPLEDEALIQKVYDEYVKEWEENSGCDCSDEDCDCDECETHCDGHCHCDSCDKD